MSPKRSSPIRQNSLFFVWSSPLAISESIRSDEEIQSIREACQIAATVLQRLVDSVEAGMTTYDLDQLGRKHIESLGAESACYNYRSGHNVFPAYTCISVNEEIVHGIGSLKRVIAVGDAVSIDVVVRYKGLSVTTPPRC